MKKKDFSLSILAMLALFTVLPLQSLAATTVKTVDITKQVWYNATDVKAAAQNFDLTDIATALGTDTATLAKSTTFLYATDIDGGLSNSITADDGAVGFWFTKDGVITKSGLDNMFFTEINVNSKANNFQIVVGAAPQATPIYTTYKATLYAVVGDKQMQINVSLTVAQKKVVAVDWSKVQFTKTFDVSIEEYARKNYNQNYAVLKLSDVAAALGTDTASLAASDADQDSLFFAKDTLGYTNKYTAGYDGFWFNSKGLMAGWNTKLNDNMYSTWYVNNYMVPQGDSLVVAIGQFPEYFAADSVVNAVEYLVYKDKAVTINLTMKILPPHAYDWANMTQTGEYSFDITKKGKDGYDATQVKLDMADIAAKLGIDVETLKSDDARLFATDDAGGKSDSYTANEPGFWFNQNGSIISWGENAYFFVEYRPADEVMNVGLYAPKSTDFPAGDKASADLFIASGDKYVKVTINLTIAADDTIPPVTEKPNISGEYTYSIGVIPADSYDVPTKLTVDLNTAAAALGEDTKTFISHLQIFSTDSLDQITKKYTCSPEPGFWFTKDGKVYNWGATAYVGCSYETSGTDGVFTFFQYPGRNKIDDVTTFDMWLVDPVLKAAVVYHISLNFVSTLLKTKVMGSTDLMIALKPDDADAHLIPIKLSDVATSFGIPSADLKDSKGNYPISLYAMTSTGMLTDAMTSDYGFWLTKDGNVCTNSDDACTFGLSYYGIPSATNQDFDNVEVSVWGDVADGDKLQGTLNLGVVRDSTILLYACNVTVYITNDPDAFLQGVNAPTIASNLSGNVYDLTGRLVCKKVNSLVGLRKGVYLFNGKKYVVK